MILVESPAITAEALCQGLPEMLVDQAQTELDATLCVAFGEPRCRC